MGGHFRGTENDQHCTVMGETPHLTHLVEVETLPCAAKTDPRRADVARVVFWPARSWSWLSASLESLTERAFTHGAHALKGSATMIQLLRCLASSCGTTRLHAFLSRLTCFVVRMTLTSESCVLQTEKFSRMSRMKEELFPIA